MTLIDNQVKPETYERKRVFSPSYEPLKTALRQNYLSSFALILFALFCRWKIENENNVHILEFHNTVFNDM